MSQRIKRSPDSGSTTTPPAQRDPDRNLLGRGARPRPVKRGSIGWEAAYRRRDDGRGTAEIPECLRGMVDLPTVEAPAEPADDWQLTEGELQSLPGAASGQVTR